MCQSCQNVAKTKTRKEAYPHATEYVTGRAALIRSMQQTAADRALPEAIAEIAKETLRHVRNNADRCYLSTSVDKHGSVSYSPRGVYRYDHKRRRSTKLGRWLGQQPWAQEWKESFRETYVSEVLARLLPIDDAIKIVTGEALRETYREEFGDGSCMSGDDCYLVLLYVNNPCYVGIVRYDDGAYTARALLWTLSDGTRLLDRIYPNSGPHIARLELWAKREGIIVRDHHGMPRGGGATFGNRHYSVILMADESDDMPYIDSFQTGDFNGDGTVTLYTNGRGDIEFISTDGSHDAQYSSGRCRCYQCGERVDIEDTRCACCGDTYCDRCYAEVYTCCYQCGTEMSADDVDVACDDEAWCQRCAERHLHQCERCNEWSHDSTNTVDGSDNWCQDCCDQHATCCEE